MATELTIYANTGTQDTALGTSGVEFTEIDTVNDEIIFTKGNATVTDGASIPSSSLLNSSAPRITGVQLEFAKCFLSDSSAGIIKEIHNLGSVNKRYVLAFDFDGETVSEPVFELWDDGDLDSVDSVILGSGTPSSSWYRGISTTDAMPGVAWTGSRLAGASDGHYLNLNAGNGELSVAKTLYCQLKCIIPATQLDAGSSAPVMAVKFATI